MALERPPKYLTLNPQGVKAYRPPDSKVSTWHTVSMSGEESWLTLQEKYGIPTARIIQFNFPGAAENGKIVPEIVNWYLRFHNDFNCPETLDGKNRRFKGGEKIAIPWLGKVEMGEPEIVERIKGNPSSLWLGAGEAHSGDLVAFGYFNWNARIYRLGTNHEGNVEWANLTSHGAKLGAGLGGSGGPILVFAHGVGSVDQFNSAFSWGDMDFDLALAFGLDAYLKTVKHVGKIVEVMDDYKKLNYVGQGLVKNKAFIKKGVYTLPIPTGPIPTGIHVWAGRKYAETFVTSSGTGL